MQPFFHSFFGGTARYNVKACPFLNNYDIVHCLGCFFASKHKTGLDRHGRFLSCGHPYEIAVSIFKIGFCGVFVGIHLNEFPGVILKPFIFFHGFVCGHKLYIFILLGRMRDCIIQNKHTA
ncbi:hypothetical protein SDC9_204519 [bioreactor metagenome]|uniref:Uncharacterized protein n=1 Tax=bioreactor metagenome TaxID=1076179 RepID=A0A645J049_9ZZZZ